MTFVVRRPDQARHLTQRAAFLDGDAPADQDDGEAFEHVDDMLDVLAGQQVPLRGLGGAAAPPETTLAPLWTRVLSLRTISMRAIGMRTISMRATCMRAVAVRAVTLRTITVRTIAPGTVAVRAMTVRTVAVRTMLAMRLPLAGLVAIVALHPRAVTVLARSVVAMGLTTVATIGPALSASLMAAMNRAAMFRALAAARAATTAAFTATLAPLLALRLPRRRRGRLLRHVLVGRDLQHGKALVGQALDALELAAFAAVAERQRDARGAGPRGAADAMDVALGLGRQLVVDDVGHALHVDATGGEVGRHEDAGAAAAEAVERISQRIIQVDHAAKPATLAELLRQEPVDRALVFTRTKHGADKVVKGLAKTGITAHAIHGNKSQNHRERVLAAFRSGEVRTLIATDIAARGIDVDGISHVVNFDLPNVPETYVHRIGRTARAGAEGTAISLVAGAEEAAYLRDIERLIRVALPREDRRSPAHRDSVTAPPHTRGGRVAQPHASTPNQPTPASKGPRRRRRRGANSGALQFSRRASHGGQTEAKGAADHIARNPRNERPNRSQRPH